MSYKSLIGRSTRSMQDNLNRNEPAIIASYRLVGAILVLGAIGYGLDRWLATSPWLLLAGLAVGLFVGFYGLARVAWGRRG
jgi:F0F1-type ATP synthase assembly protein I